MDDYWRDYLANAGLRLSPNVSGSYPPSARRRRRATSTPCASRCSTRGACSHAVLTCLTAFDASRNGYYEAALCSAINDWLRAEWLERDERLRAYLTIPTLDPDAAIQEIERVGDHDGFVGVLVPIRSETRWGNRRFHDLHEAIAAKDLVLALHAWGRAGQRADRERLHPHLLRGLPGQLADRRPGAGAQPRLRGRLRARPGAARGPARVRLLVAAAAAVALRQGLEGRLARGARGSRSGRRSTCARHVRAATAPAQLPADPSRPRSWPRCSARATCSSSPATSRTSTATGNLDTLLDALDDAGREAVLRGNAAALYGLAG